MNIKVLSPIGIDAGNLLPSVCLQPFCDLSVGFLEALSGRLLRNPLSKRYPELVALGFWLRRAHVRLLQGMFESTIPEGCLRAPKGSVFHIAPGNVDTIFVYSLILSLLVGNSNVVRISSRGSEQINVLVSEINALIDSVEFKPLADSIRIVQYERDREVTDYLSWHCDLRVIWGGDASITAIRQSPIPAHAIDVTFSDKYSLSIVSSDGWNSLSSEERVKLAAAFCVDASTFNQQACSSPRMLVWLGDVSSVKTAQTDFWLKVMDLWSSRETLQAVDYSNRVLYAQNHMIATGSVLNGGLSDVLYRLQLPVVSRAEDIPFCGSGVFAELQVEDVTQLLPVIDRKVQTVTYCAIERERLIALMHPLFSKGIDRIVPFGQALEFNPVWDGYNLWDAFSRIVSSFGN